jgi:hypothetical protein
MGIYPLPIRFPVPIDGTSGKKAREEGRDLRRDEYIDVTITREGWSFQTSADRLHFERQPVADRLTYRKCFEAQVSLAKDTPKGES